MSRARATIVLVTWNSRARVLELLRAIQGLTRGPYQLVVVDNASTDGLQEDLRALASQTLPNDN